MSGLGPHVVAVGGGHGTAVTLRAVRRFAHRITAIVSVADDGGSSGRLRDALGIPAPGDLRRCLVALADADSPLARAFEHRFEAGELEGHPVGNLLIAGLAAAMGDFTAALAEAGRLLDAVGVVLPATGEPVVLKARGAHGEAIGQVAATQVGELSRISLVPEDARSPEAVPQAIRDADLVVLGPGSLFTSVLAAAVVPAVSAALASTDAPVVYVANLRAGGETAGFDVGDHVRALLDHGVCPAIVLHDSDALPLGDLASEVVGIAASVADVRATAHDPGRLAEALTDLVGWKTQQRS